VAKNKSPYYFIGFEQNRKHEKCQVLFFMARLNPLASYNNPQALVNRKKITSTFRKIFT